jgi:hypothetical protein
LLGAPEADEGGVRDSERVLVDPAEGPGSLRAAIVTHGMLTSAHELMTSVHEMMTSAHHGMAW